MLLLADDDRDHPEWKEQFADVCKESFLDCHCSAVFRESVGREFPRFGAPSPPGLPGVCTQDYYAWTGIANARNSSFINITEGVELAECCDMCTNINDDKGLCGSYTFLPDTADQKSTSSLGSCTLYGETSFHDLTYAKRKDQVFGFFSGDGIAAQVQKAVGTLSMLMNGTWFSTQVGSVLQVHVSWCHVSFVLRRVSA